MTKLLSIERNKKEFKYSEYMLQLLLSLLKSYKKQLSDRYRSHKTTVSLHRCSFLKLGEGEW